MYNKDVSCDVVFILYTLLMKLSLEHHWHNVVIMGKITSLFSLKCNRGREKVRLLLFTDDNSSSVKNKVEANRERRTVGQ